MRIGEYEGRAATAADDELYLQTGAGETPETLCPQSEIALLRELGIGKPSIEAAARKAERYGTSIESELLSSGLVTESSYYAALARLLRLPYVERIGDNLIKDSARLDQQLLRPSIVRLNHSRKALTVIVPEARKVSHLRRLLAQLPELRDAIAIASPSTVRGAVWTAGAARRVRDAVNSLFERQPRFSARVVFSGKQGFYAGISCSLLVAALATSGLALLTLHIAISSLYLAALLLRIRAVTFRRQRTTPMPAADDGELPVYTVLVACYREAEVAAQLVKTLKRLNWPPSRLDIKLVCEADDHETIDAFRAQGLGNHFEIVEVPAMKPRTKPKALSYALAGARGRYVAVYDAEDRPHPDQLREAHARFCAAPEDVACLQAPLIIANGRESWISALFSLEYSALFRALLPMLARNRMPLPLGGTSNHFRKDVLIANGAWDPFNVTEDADLGMRLFRLGYRSEVISRQTLEDAPVTLRVWTGQRTRWFKGWLQTWLVLMRDPGGLRREMGTRAFLIFHLLIGGMLISSLAHPLMFAFVVQAAVAMLEAPAVGIPLRDRVLFVIDFVNLFGSYATFLVLGMAAMIEHEKRQIGWRWAAVPIYWLMVSFAAWRAVLELRTNPFFWHKTPHRPSAQLGAKPS
ncbi:glycosyltransferase family 2 protein [Rhizobium sp. BK251]|uniref:glycosyltransferase family 2 protein n=1 Tax=Rhizobium sp. BK251 TaxID=2512125 RepID=UPI0010504710|nr:glycosyltransferase family 2 protein [Rhizobium sp. BK251]TCL75511.1 cellulose synthase/poly-beta-1,6-N-acetylglucosamine synthase-like glycosyltransferase [Rhizobium sp. BK251]